MEMSLQGAIDHPFIVKVEHIYDAPEMVILVMPFLSNGSWGAVKPKLWTHCIVVSVAME